MRPPLFLNKQQVFEVVHANQYLPKDQLQSRDIEGGYPNSASLPAVSIPGADIGDIVTIISAGNSYGFEVNIEKTIAVIKTVVKNIHISKNAYWNQVVKDPAGYSLEKEQLKTLERYIAALPDGQKLPGERREGAAIMVKGAWGVLPQYTIETEEGVVPVSVFCLQQSLAQQRHRLLSKELVEKGAVKLYDKLDHEYLYDVLATVLEDHWYETLKRIAPGVPLFEVVFNEDGNFVVNDWGYIVSETAA